MRMMLASPSPLEEKPERERRESGHPSMSRQVALPFCPSGLAWLVPVVAGIRLQPVHTTNAKPEFSPLNRKYHRLRWYFFVQSVQLSQ